jgi:hypothetical protein
MLKKRKRCVLLAMVAVYAMRTMTVCVRKRMKMIRCVICDAWYEDDELDEELAAPTCKGCGAV